MSNRTESDVGAVRELSGERKPNRLGCKTAWHLQPVTLWGKVGGGTRCGFWGENSGLTRECLGCSPKGMDSVLRVN